MFNVQILIDGDAAKRAGVPPKLRVWLNLNQKPVIRKAVAERIRKNASIDFPGHTIRIHPVQRLAETRVGLVNGKRQPYMVRA